MWVAIASVYNHKIKHCLLCMVPDYKCLYLMDNDCAVYYSQWFKSLPVVVNICYINFFTVNCNFIIDNVDEKHFYKFYEVIISTYLKWIVNKTKLNLFEGKRRENSEIPA